MSALTALSRHENATLYMLLLSAFKALLLRYSGQPDVIVGGVVAGRGHLATERLLGAFVNPLVLRTDLSGDPTFREALQRVRRTCLEAYAHQDVPFELLVQALHPERDLSRTPLFQIAFNLEDFGEAAAGAGALQVSFFDLDAEVALYDLAVEVRRRGDQLDCAFTYSTCLFEPATVSRMAGHFRTLLEGALADPGQRLSALPLLSAAERHQILVEWNETPSAHLQDTCIHRLVEAQVQRTPDAIAVLCGEQELSYRELDARATRLAQHLCALGVGPETLVGVCLERSPDLVVCLLGILKAGGAYVPLDARYPSERLAYMLEDTRSGVIVTQTSLKGRLPAPPAPAEGPTLVLLDNEGALAGPSDQSLPQVDPHNLAYVLYTSGSTGRPKGVAIEHHSLGTLVQFATRIYSASQLAGTLASSPICFDLSAFELFVTLSAGGTVILAENALQLPLLPAAGRVTFMNSVPSVIAELLRMGPLPASVRTVGVGGEPVTAALVDQLYDQPAVQAVYDLYGPTECTVYATCALRRRHGPETIGRPVDGARAYILDQHGQPVPVGVPGELYLGGKALARGYLNRPELTAERFLPDPFFPLPGGRMYRTGDRARWLADGNLVFLGRDDDQIKVRGYRIEPGEVQAAMAAHPAVRDVVVTAHRNATGDQSLAAYVVLRAGQRISGAELRGSLQGVLPDYMVPTDYVFLDALPRTASGKADRRALPAPSAASAVPECGRVAPRTAVEQILADIWQEVLGREPIGVEDDFFDLGGHSLLAVRLLARIERAFGQRLPLALFYQAPTIAQVALLLDRHLPVRTPSLVAIQPYGSRPPLFVVPPVAMANDTMGAMYCYRALASLLGPDQPVLGLQPKGMDGADAPHSSIEDMARYYAQVVRNACPAGPYLVAGQCHGGLVAYELARQLRLQHRDVRLVALLDSQAHSAPLNFRGLPPIAILSRAVQRAVRRLQRRLSRLAGGSRAGKRGTPQAGGTVLQSFWIAFNRYRPRTYPGSVTLFQAQTHARTRWDPETAGWRALALGAVEVHDVPGHHRDILKEPNVRALARALSGCIERALAEQSSPAAPGAR